MTAASKASIVTSFNKDRLDWALRAYEAFVADLPEDLQIHFNRHRSEVTTAVYGRSQVGKTTIILQLLGIEADPNSGPYRVLRGGRELGTSATATAMRYRLSADDTWVWEAPPNPPERFRCDEEDKVIELVKSLRDRVEAGDESSGSDVWLSIPSRYVTTSSEFAVSIIDLPGIEAKNQHERQHAIDLANKYLPTADAVVLVGTVDALTFLDPASIDIDHLQRWWAIQDRAKIVTTRTYSDNTIRQKIAKGSNTPESLRQYVVEQIKTHGFPESVPWDKVQRNVYPIECGDSWRALRTSKGAYPAAANELNSQFMSELHRDLERNASLEARISTAFKARAVYEDVLNSKLEDARSKHEALEQEKRKTVAESGQQKKACDAYKAEIERSEGSAKRLRAAISEMPRAELTRDEIRSWLRIDSHYARDAHRLRKKAEDLLKKSREVHRKEWRQWARKTAIQGIEAHLDLHGKRPHRKPSSTSFDGQPLGTAQDPVHGC